MPSKSVRANTPTLNCDTNHEYRFLEHVGQGRRVGLHLPPASEGIANPRAGYGKTSSGSFPGLTISAEVSIGRANTG